MSNISKQPENINHKVSVIKLTKTNVCTNEYYYTHIKSQYIFRHWKKNSFTFTSSFIFIINSLLMSVDTIQKGN